MSEVKPNGGSAFPLFDGSAHYGGMTLRDWLAGMSMSGILHMIAAGQHHPIEQGAEGVAKQAYRIADAMLTERARS